jgi:phosphate transport system substrate-binding protein
LAGIGLGAKGSEGVAGQVKQISGAIGYGELAYADQSKIPYADMKNSSGNFISPAPASVSAALATAKIPDDFRFSMVNPPGDQAYPIAGASWNPDHGKKLAAFLKWAVTDGQKISSTLDYAPLPDNVQSRELDLIGTIKY